MNLAFQLLDGNGMETDNLLDTIVRFHDISRLPELERCIFSLVCQKHRPLNIIVVTQRFTDEECALVQTSVNPLLMSDEPPSFAIYNWNQDTPRDGRAHLLNLGITKATGRYLAFLDYDDTLFPEAYQLLIEKCQQTHAAVVFASVQLMAVEVFQRFHYSKGIVLPAPFSGRDINDLLRNNFCPLHSYLFDRQAILSSDQYIDTSLTIEEDYELLLRVCSQYESNFSLLGTIIGKYYYKSDGSNTVATQGLTSVAHRDYMKVCAKIENQRKNIKMSSNVLKKLGIQGDKEITIREYLDTLPTIIYNQDPSKEIFFENIIHLFHEKGGLIKILNKVITTYRYEGLQGLKKRVINSIKNKP